MTAVARKALSSVMNLVGWGDRDGSLRRETPVKDPHTRLGKYVVDYSAPSREEIDMPNEELEKLFARSKVVSAKREM